jgi:hypothetical protein
MQTAAAFQVMLPDCPAGLFPVLMLRAVLLLLCCPVDCCCLCCWRHVQHYGVIPAPPSSRQAIWSEQVWSHNLGPSRQIFCNRSLNMKQIKVGTSGNHL